MGEIFYSSSQRADPCLAVGCDRHSDRPPAGAGAGGVLGGEESEAAAGGQGRRKQAETPVHGHGQRPQTQGAGNARAPPTAQGRIQQRQREDQLEEKEKSEGSGEKETEGTAGGGCHSNAVREAALKDRRGCFVCWRNDVKEKTGRVRKRSSCIVFSHFYYIIL